MIVGNVFDSPEILEAYSTDRSILKIKPKYVALPESTDDIRKLMKFCYQLASKNIRIPIAIRGSGLDELGGDLTNGLVISTEKLNRLLESDKRERLVRVQAGITLKELNTALSVNGLTIPIGGHEMETIGGLISNCPKDSFSAKYGGIMNFVERVEVVLPNGDVLQTSRQSKHNLAKRAQQKGLENEVYRKIATLAKVNEALLKKMREHGAGLAGYPTITLTERKGSVDLMPLFFGAEGTLGVITEVILRAVPLHKETKRVLATFEDFNVAQKFMDVVNALKPRELNIYDIEIIRTAEETGKRLNDVTKKMEKGYVVFAKFDSKNKSCLRKVAGVRKALPRSSQLFVENGKTVATLNEFENSLISFLNYTRSGERIPVLTDFYLPAHNLERFMTDLTLLEKNLKLNLAIYGSYSSSNYSLRPKFNLEKDDYRKSVVTFLKTGAYVIGRQGGSITGGSPEGRVKAIVTNAEMSESEAKLYKAIKQAFDRYNVLGSTVKLGAAPNYTIAHFRTTSSAKIVI